MRVKKIENNSKSRDKKVTKKRVVANRKEELLVTGYVTFQILSFSKYILLINLM
jgi:hypothetical protein